MADDVVELIKANPEQFRTAVSVRIRTWVTTVTNIEILYNDGSTGHHNCDERNYPGEWGRWEPLWDIKKEG